jgi:predicted secreted protein
MTMRGIIGAFALAVLTLPFLASPVAALEPHSPVFTDAAETIVVQSGEEFFIALPSNETTGYTWTQSIGSGTVLAYEGNVYQRPSNGGLGAGGQQIFIYHANRSGSTSVTFNYTRPFEPNAAAAKTLTFGVTVH